ncbi:nicotinamide riboside transporter PnuC [Bacteroidales bacterium]
MAAADFYSLFLDNLRHTTWIEAIAVFFGLLSVWYSARINILVYPTGIVNVTIFVYICLRAGLYADMAINVVYFVMSVYGWYNWLRPRENKTVLPVRFAGKRINLFSLGATLLLFFAIRTVLIHYTDSTVPSIDAFTTALFIIAMWLMATKRVENWIYWIAGDVVSVPLYFYKGLVLSSFQYLVFLVLAVVGLIAWRKEALNG